MEIQATYEDGHLLFDEAVTLKHPRIRVTVVVADDEVGELEQQIGSSNGSVREYPILGRLAAILGPYARQRRGYSIGEDRRTLGDVLMEKYGQ
ncbi:MAG: hypothetical protein HZB55_19635 [Deltaproteobacteria bacterium]|nr:hypothetical protein [Deltaproteobacteria bacterium]